MNEDIRELTPGEIDRAAGGVTLQFGPVNIWAGEHGLGVSITGVAGFSISKDGAEAHVGNASVGV